MTEPHDAPDIGELVEAVREWLERDVMEATEGRLRFHARVAVNVLAIVERELELGPEQAERHRTRLASIGVADDADLAAAIRRDDLPADLADVLSVLRAAVDDKLDVANPRYRDR
ncbi:DUF6285 domain-containing protein [Ilumatobacter sp.]|uniref:DUF6285 domain-containing protein n=1 Tax=Ilumatobacter sp. TaxID=1967498 RepID=UPI003B5154EF